MRPLLIALLVVFVGCNLPDRVSRLEKETSELRAEVKQAKATNDYNLQARCAKDAKLWFNENFTRDKTTVFLTYTDHYKRQQNKCFILVEEHSSITPGSASWMNDINIWDVYENSQYASLSESHTVNYPNTETNLLACEYLGNKCKGMEEFNRLTLLLMSN